MCRAKALKHQAGPESNRSLLDEHAKLVREQEMNPMTEEEKQLQEEAEILKATETANKLASAQEHALGIKFDKSHPTSWRPPK